MAVGRGKRRIVQSDLYSVPNFKHNVGVVSFCRVITSVLAGIVAGVLGITGLSGFLFYIVFHALLAVPLLLKAQFQVKKYFRNWTTPFLSFIFTSQGMLSFLLFWIIFYNIAHVF